MNHYHHLTLSEREDILRFHSQGLTITAIAEKLHRNKSTISREISRNMKDGKYSPSQTQEAYLERRKACHRSRILDDQNHYDLVKSCFLDHQWSPEEISERLKYENADWSISYNTIYRAIYAGLFDEKNKSHGNRGCCSEAQTSR